MAPQLFVNLQFAIALVVLPFLATYSPAAEIHSNGRGGGPWSEAGSWRGGAVPKAEDDVVISRGDVVVFDRNDDGVAFAETGIAMVGVADQPLVGAVTASAALLVGTTGKTTCQKLSIDPKGMLTFKTGAGKVVLCVAGVIESYGTIKLDARISANDHQELRLTGTTAEKRVLQLKKGGAFLVLGRANLPEGRHNITLTSLAQPAVKYPESDPEGLGNIEGEAGTMIDVQQAHLVNVQLKAVSIDNTGAKPNERFNVAQNRFSERSRVHTNSCDTPVIVNNVFEYTGVPVPHAAIYPYACALAEIRGNTIRGNYAYGIMGSAMTDSVIAGNTIEKCSAGIYWYGENGMLKQNTIRGCPTGIVVTSMSGALEDITIEGCQVGYNHAGATTQLSNVQISKLPKDGKAIVYASGPLTLLNCNVASEQIEVLKIDRTGVPRPAFFVETMSYLVVGIKGEAPLGTKVEVLTANPAKPLPPGAADLNIRNAPAPLMRNNLTPLPKSAQSLVVRSWMIDADGRIVPAPEYAVRVVHGARVIHSMNVKPDVKWFRDKPNDAVPTLEVEVK